MNTRSMPTRRVNKEVMNDGVPPQRGQAPQSVQVHQGEQLIIANQGNEVPLVPPDMSSEEVRGSLVI